MSQPNKIVVVVAVNVIVFVVTLVTDDIVVALKVGQNWVSNSLNIKFLCCQNPNITSTQRLGLT